MIENKKPGFFYGYIVVIAAFCIMMVSGGTFFTFGIFFKPLLTEFGWTRAELSGAFSLFMVFHGLLYIVTGRLTDRFGPRLVVAASGFFLGLGYLLMSQISAIWHIYLFYGVIVAIGMSGLFVPVTSIIPRWFVKRRGIMTGIVVSGIGMGTMIMSTIASWLIASYGWSTCYVVVGVIALVFIIAAAQFLRHDPRQMGQVAYGEGEVKEQRLNLEAQGFSLREVIYTRQFWMLCAIFLCFGFGIQTIMVHIVPHAIELRIPETTASSILVIIGGLSIAGRLMMGSTSDRVGNKPAIVICFIVMLVALLWLLVTAEVWMLFLFAAIFGFAYGGLVTLQSPVIAELFGLSSLGAILGGITFSVTIGGAIGPLLAGYIFDIMGSYQLAFLIGAAISIIGLILSALLKPISEKGGKNDSRRGT